jgi:hypothetical protein
MSEKYFDDIILSVRIRRQLCPSFHQAKKEKMMKSPFGILEDVLGPPKKIPTEERVPVRAFFVSFVLQDVLFNSFYLAFCEHGT